MNRYIIFCFTVSTFLLGCSTDEESTGIEAAESKSDTLFASVNYPYGEDTHPRKLQMCVNSMSFSLLDSLENYEAIKVTLNFTRNSETFIVNRDYRESLIAISNVNGLFAAENYLNDQLSGEMIDRLNEVQKFVLSRDPELQGSNYVPMGYTDYLKVALEYVTTRDKKYRRWITAVHAYCCDNPDFPEYDCDILSTLEQYAIDWKKVGEQ